MGISCPLIRSNRHSLSHHHQGFVFGDHEYNHDHWIEKHRISITKKVGNSLELEDTWISFVFSDALSWNIWQETQCDPGKVPLDTVLQHNKFTTKTKVHIRCCSPSISIILGVLTTISTIYVKSDAWSFSRISINCFSVSLYCTVTSSRWILKSRGYVDVTTRRWPRAGVPEASSYLWCLQSHRKWLPGDLLSGSEHRRPSWFFRYEISNLFFSTTRIKNIKM